MYIYIYIYIYINMYKYAYIGVSGTFGHLRIPGTGQILSRSVWMSGPCPADKVWVSTRGRDTNKKDDICTLSARAKNSVTRPSIVETHSDMSIQQTHLSHNQNRGEELFEDIAN